MKQLRLMRILNNKYWEKTKFINKWTNISNPLSVSQNKTKRIFIKPKRINDGLNKTKKKKSNQKNKKWSHISNLER